MALVHQMSGCDDSALICFQAALDLAHGKIAQPHGLVKTIKTNRDRLLEQTRQNAA